MWSAAAGGRFRGEGSVATAWGGGERMRCIEASGRERWTTFQNAPANFVPLPPGDGWASGRSCLRH